MRHYLICHWGPTVEWDSPGWILILPPTNRDWKSIRRTKQRPRRARVPGEQWLTLHGVDAHAVHGMLLDQFATASQAAISGLGVALLPEFLIEEELSTGKLVRALDLPMKSAEAYYLVWPTDRASHPPLVAFREWLLLETAPDR